MYLVFVCLFALLARGDPPDSYYKIQGCTDQDGTASPVSEIQPIDAFYSVVQERSLFNVLASGNEAASSMQLSEVKFLITDIRTDNPRLYFINSSDYEYHWKFFNDALGWNLPLLDFNTRTYTDFNRRLIAGSVVAHDRYKTDEFSEGVFAIEFWPSDPIHFDDAALAFNLISSGMEFAEGRIVYHPTGETQVQIYRNERESFELNGVPVLLTTELYDGVDYAALNIGTSCGILRDGNSGEQFTSRDIVVFESIPNDISHVAGIITTIPQTPLSHINLKAIQNGTPNVFITGFMDTPEFQSLLGRYVRLTALPECYTIEEISYVDAMDWLESARPDTVTILRRDVTEIRILSLDEIRLIDSAAYGAKAASLGELTWCLPSASVPDGVAIPFYYYHKFMEYNELYHAVSSLIAQEDFSATVDGRDSILREIRQTIRECEIPPWMMDSLSAMTHQFESGIPLRCRSSTNNEDLSGFNGAGLYSSYTHHSEEGHISETIKQVWAGMWTYRAFEEREFYRIDHFSCAMGVLVHPSYRNELANGVAVTANIFNPFVPGYYINSQRGEDMVTNPELESIPEELIVTEQNITGNSVREIQYTGLSNRVSAGEKVLSEEQIDQLADYLGVIHNHYSSVYGIESDESYFAMEIEFKITCDGELVVKQARPWVFGI